MRNEYENTSTEIIACVKLVFTKFVYSMKKTPVHRTSAYCYKKALRMC